MLKACNESNESIYITDSRSDQKYHCSLCEREVIRKIGNGGRRPHFAHKASVEGDSCDGWHYDMTDWHLDWQEKFPVKCQEVVVEHDGKKHRADVLIEEQRLVIEFQHSCLSPEEYSDRNRFYKLCGYDVVWLFDMNDDFKENRFETIEDSNEYRWKRPWATFRNTNGNFMPNAPREFTWESDTQAVFFEHGDTVERLLDYDEEKRTVLLSKNDGTDAFYWSQLTFFLWLMHTGYRYSMYSPKCPKCQLPMLLHRYSITGDFFWGCPNYYKEINCKERIDIGFMPINVSVDGKCPYCGSYISRSDRKIECKRCSYSVYLDVV